MRIRLVVPEKDVSPEVIEPALETVTRVNEALIKRGAPLALDAISAGKVKWRPEPPGDEHFDTSDTVLSRGWGDCDDLGPWHAASLRASGEDTGARAIIKKSGPGLWHCVVERSDGSRDDPSKWAGMGKGKSTVAGYAGGVMGASIHGSRPVHEILPGLAMKNHRGIWVVRSETPAEYERSDRAGFAVHTAGEDPTALVLGACNSAARIARVCGDEPRRREWCAMRDMMAGIHPHYVSERHAVDGWGLFRRLGRGLSRAASGVANAGRSGLALASRVPGVQFLPGGQAVLLANGLAQGGSPWAALANAGAGMLPGGAQALKFASGVARGGNVWSGLQDAGLDAAGGFIGPGAMAALQAAQAGEAPWGLASDYLPGGRMAANIQRSYGQL